MKTRTEYTLSPLFFIYRIRGISVFRGKNSKVLKLRKHKGFCVFLLYGIVIVFLKEGEKGLKVAFLGG